MACCASIGRALQRIVKALAPILAIALVCFAVYLAFWIGPAALGTVEALAWLPAGMAAITGTTAAYYALGTALVVDALGGGTVTKAAATAVGKVAGTVIASVATGVAAGVTGGNLALWVLLGVGAYLLLSSDDSQDATVKLEQT